MHVLRCIYVSSSVDPPDGWRCYKSQFCRSPDSLKLTHLCPFTTALNMAEQIEKSFQKQPIFHNTKVAVKKVGGKDRRWYKDVGLGFKVRG